MEFRQGNPERRHDRRICPKCATRCADRPTCPACGRETRPRIRVVWFIGRKRYRRLTSCWREQDAREILQGIEADYWRQQRLGVTRDIGGSMASAVAAFERAKSDMSKNWQAQIRKALYPLRDGLGADTEVTQVTRDDLEEYLDDGLTARSAATMRSYMLVVRCFFGWLESEGWIRLDPSRKVKLPRAGRRHWDYLAPDEVAPVLDACWQVQPAFAPVYLAMVLGSFRKGEVVNLRHRDMDFDARWAYVLDFEGDELTEAWSAKSESSRRGVPLHPLLADTLRRIEPVTRPDGTLSPWVFPVTDARRKVRLRDRRGRVHPVRGDRRSPQTTWLGSCLRQALAAAGIERRVTVHGLRRTFAVLLQDAGAPDSVIRQALGHAQQGVTEQHYLPRRDPVVQSWVDRIELSRAGRPVATSLPSDAPLGARSEPATVIFDVRGGEQPAGPASLPSGACLVPGSRLLQ